MDVKNIITFLEVADTKSFSLSANNLDITQPAVSKRVATLEEQLSTRLFDRIGRKVLLTDAAEELLPLARKIVSEINLLEDRMFQLGNSVAGNLGVVSSPYVANTHLPFILKNFKSEFPEVEISLEIRPSPALIKDMEHGLFELGLCELPQPLSGDLKSANIWHEKLRVVVSPAHPLAALPQVYPEELTSHPSILPAPTTTSHGLITDALAKHGCRTKNTMIVPDFNTLAKMVDIGIGWGVLPQSMCADKSIRVLTLDSIDLDLCPSLIFHRNLTLSQAATAFAKALPGRVTSNSVP